MKRYRVKLWLNGRYIQTEIQANGYTQAREMVAAMYPGATGVIVDEI